MSDMDISGESTELHPSGPSLRKELDTNPGAIKIPDVEVQGVVAWGGMAALYRGVQPFLNRTVAVKVLRQAGTWSEELDERFQREARLLAELSDPHIVSCFSAGKLEDGSCYLVMEFVDGPNLAEHVRSHGTLSESDALLVIRDMAMALQHAKERGIIHRDVKPQNILLKPVTAQDTRTSGFGYIAKLADLGIARYEGGGSAQSDLALTQQGQFIGTPAYMAPEQFGDAMHADHRADIYGLGGVLYFSLCGTSPYASENISNIIRKKSLGELKSVRSMKPQISVKVEELINDMLAAEKEKRPQSYQEIINRCERLIATSPTKTASNKPAPAPGVLIVIAALLILAAFGILVSMKLMKVTGQERPDGEVAGLIDSESVTLSSEELVEPESAAIQTDDPTMPVEEVVPSPVETPMPTMPVPVALPLVFTTAPRLLLTGEIMSRLNGWRIDGAFAPDEESEEGAIGVSVGNKPSMMTMKLPPAPWRFTGELDLAHGREGGVRLASGEEYIALRVQNLGSSLIIRVEDSEGVKEVLCTNDQGTELGFMITFDGAEVRLNANGNLYSSEGFQPKEISLVALGASAGFRNVSIQDNSTNLE